MGFVPPEAKKVSNLNGKAGFVPPEVKKKDDGIEPSLESAELPTELFAEQPSVPEEEIVSAPPVEGEITPPEDQFALPTEQRGPDVGLQLQQQKEAEEFQKVFSQRGVRQYEKDLAQYQEAAKHVPEGKVTPGQEEYEESNKSINFALSELKDTQDKLRDPEFFNSLTDNQKRFEIAKIQAMENEITRNAEEIVVARDESGDPYLGMTVQQRQNAIAKESLFKKYDIEQVEILEEIGYDKKMGLPELNLREQGTVKTILSDFEQSLQTLRDRDYDKYISSIGKSKKELLRDYLNEEVYPKLRHDIKSFGGTAMFGLFNLGSGRFADIPGLEAGDEDVNVGTEEVAESLKGALALMLAVQYDHDPTQYLDKLEMKKWDSLENVGGNILTAGKVAAGFTEGLTAGMTSILELGTGTDKSLAGFRVDQMLDDVTDISQNYERVLREVGVEVPENVSEMSESTRSEKWRSGLALTGEMVPEFILIEVLTAGAGTVLAEARVAKKFVDFYAKINKLNKITNNKAVRLGTKAILKSIDYTKQGLKYEAVGYLFEDAKDEANFASGVAGGAGADVGAWMLKGISLLPGMRRLGGVKAEKIANFFSRGVGEVFEETAQSLQQIYAEGGDWGDVKEQFTGDNLVDFLAMTYIMGTAMGSSQSIVDQKKGAEMLDYVENQKAALNPEQIKLLENASGQSAIKEVVDETLLEEKPAVEEEKGVQTERQQEIEARFKEIDAEIEGKSLEEAAPLSEEKLKLQEEYNKITEDAISIKTADEIPVQPEAKVGEEVEKGVPEAKPVEVTEVQPIEAEKEAVERVGEAEPEVEIEKPVRLEVKSEYESESGNQTATINEDTGKLEILNKDGSTPDPKTARKVRREYESKLDYFAGEELQTKTSNQDLADSEIANESSNLAQIVKVFVDRTQMQKNVGENFGSVDWNIAQVLGKVNLKSLGDNWDPNNITNQIRQNYVNIKEQAEGSRIYNLDMIAAEISDNAGIDVTEADIVDFIAANPGGIKDWKSKFQDQTIIDAEARFETLTGLKINDNVIAQVEEQRLQQLGVNESLIKETENEYAQDQFQSFLESEVGEDVIKGAEVVDVEEARREVEPEGAEIKPPIPPVEEIISEEERVPEEKERRFAKQVLEDKRISKEVKEGVKPKAKYTPKKMTTTEAEAEQVIKDLDIQDANDLFLDPKSDLDEDVRVVLGQKLILKYNSSAQEATDVQEKKKLYNRAITVANTLAEFHTKMGRASNAAKVYFSLSPEGQLIALQKSIGKTRKAKFDEDKEYLSNIEDIILNANEETVSEILKSPKIKKAIEEIYGKASKRGEKSTPKSKSRKKRIVNQAIDFLDTLKIDTSGKAFDVTYALTAHVWNGAISTMQASLKAGVAISDAINSAIDYVKNNHKGVWDEEGFKRDMGGKMNKYTALNDINEGDYSKGVQKGLKEIGTDINEIVRKHYTEQDKTKTKLVDKFIEELELTEPEASQIAKEIEKAFNDLATNKKRTELNKLLSPKNPFQKKENKKKKKLQDKIIELSNLGALSNEDLQNAYAENMELPELTDEQAKEIVRLAEIAQTAKGQIAQSKTQKDLLSFQRKIKGFNWQEVGVSLWYAHMLSGPTTQALNIWANTFETAGEVFVSTVQDPRNFPLLLKGLLKGYGRGGRDFRAIMSTKYGSVKGIKMDIPNVLEDYKFKHVKIKGKIVLPWIASPLNLSKYVARVMDAADTFFYHGLKEMRFHQLAALEVRKKGLKEPNKSIYNKVSEILYNTEEELENAKKVAFEEGYIQKTLPFKRRVSEIIEEKRDVDWSEDADDFASRGTFNYDPEGTLGLMSNQINSLTGKIPPLRFLIPFTRILANVTNKYMDWSPIGALRYMKDGIGWGEGKRKFTKEERKRVGIKFLAGTMAMIALASLDDGEDDDGDFEITANGYGDRRKNYELADAKGWQEYSIRIGDVWYSYKNTPLGIGLAIVGYARDSNRYLGDKDARIQSSAAIMGMVKYTMSFSFMKGVADFMSIFGDAPVGQQAGAVNKIEKIFVRGAKSLVVPNIISQSNRLYQEFTDQPIKKASTWHEEFYKDIPYFNDKMLNIYNSLGDEVIPELSGRLIPFNMKSVKHGNVYTLLQRNKVFIGGPSRTITINGVKRKLDDKEYNEYGRISGQKIKEKIIDNYDFLLDKDSDDFKDLIDDYKSESRRQTRENLFSE